MKSRFPKAVPLLWLVLLLALSGGFYWQLVDRPNTSPAAAGAAPRRGDRPTRTATVVKPPAAAAGAATRALRFLGPKPDRRLQTSAADVDRWDKAVTLAEASEAVPDLPALRQRVRIVRTDFKYPLLRLEEVVRLDPTTQEETIVSQVAMVADHLVLQPAAGVSEATLVAQISGEGGVILKRQPASGIFLVTIPAAQDPDGLPQALARFKQATGLQTIVEPDFVVYTSDQTPNDPSYPLLWGLHNTGQTGGTADADIDAPEAWMYLTGSRTIRVGVIDTGIDYTHPDLAANIWANPNEIAGNGVDDDGNGYIDDVHGWDFCNDDNDPMDDHYHGTHCAGTIGAVGGNSVGVVGVNWQVSLVALKFLSSSGSGATSDAVEAVAYANGLGLNLTSNSWGGGGYSQTLYNAISAANTAGHLFVAAAGNSAVNTDTTTNYPSCYDLPNIIAVAATNSTDALASFSNYGATTVDLAAPGVSIYSTIPGSSYSTLSGTSMATPHVAGAAALLLSGNSTLTAAELKSLLLSTVDPLSALTGKTVAGGRLNVASAIEALDGLLISPATTWSARGPIGGPFSVSGTTYTLCNLSATARSWTASTDVTWAQVSPASGTVAAGGSATITVALVDTAAQALDQGEFSGTLTLIEISSGTASSRALALTVMPPVAYAYDLSTDPGWARTGQWAYGQPSGGGGASYGYPDPTSGYTGNNVFGVNLSGDYALDIGNTYTLTAGPFDLTGYTNTRLSFQRWLNTDYQPYVTALVEISTDGTTWSTLWSNSSSSLLADSAWTEQYLDISSYANDQATVYVRWSYGVASSGADPLSGWNIDDITIRGNPPRTVRFDSVSPLAENAGSLNTLLRFDPAPTAPVEVSFTSSAPTLLPAPASITVPADSLSAPVPVSLVDNTLLDGTRTVTLTPRASSYTAIPLTMTVQDNESATLTLALPTAATEGSTGTGTVTVSQAPAAAITVALVSSLTDAVGVPASVVIAASTTSASFTLTYPDNQRIEGARTATITASVAGWTGAQGDVTVADNESRTLTLTTTASFAEGAGTVSSSGTVSLPGTLDTDLTVTLASNDTSELTVPASVTIPAGNTSASFAISVVDDSDTDGMQSVTLTASASSFTSGQTIATVADNDPAAFTFATISSPQYLGQAFTAQITARDINGAVATGFTGTVALSGNTGTAAGSLTPTQTTAFTAGTWSGALTLLATGETWTVQAASDSATGTSNSFRVLTPAVQTITLATNDLVYDAGTERFYATTSSGTIVPINPADGTTGTPVTVASTAATLLARAADGSLLWVSSASGKQIQQVRLPGLTLGDTITITDSYPAIDLAPLPDTPGALATLEGDSYYQRIRVYDGNVARTNIATGNYMATRMRAGAVGRLYAYNGYTSGYEFRRYSITASGVSAVDAYSAVLSGYYLDFQADGQLVAGSSGQIIDGETHSRLATLPYTGAVCPDTTAGRVYLLSQQSGTTYRLHTYDTARYAEVGYLDITGVTGTPANLIRWGAGGLAFRTPTQVFILNSVLVPTTESANLQLTQLVSPNPAVVGQPLYYLLNVRNLGNGTAQSVTLTDTLPSGISLAEAVASQGTVVTDSASGTVVANFGELAANTEATLRLRCTVTAAGSVTNTAVVIGTTGDPDTTNNTSTSTTTVKTAGSLSLRSISLGARDVAYDPTADRLLVTLGLSASTLPNSMLRLDPVTLAPHAADFVGSNPGRIKLTSDGQYAYIILDGSYGVSRAPVVAGTSASLNFPIGHTGTTYGFLRANDITPITGRPGVVAVRRQVVTSTGGYGVALFEDGVQLAKTTTDVYSSDQLVDAASSTRIYGFCSASSSFQLSQYTVDSNGLSLDSEKWCVLTGYDVTRLKRAGSLIYANNGQIADPEALTLIASMGITGPMEPSVDDEAFYILSGATLYAYDLLTRSLLGTLALGTLDGTPNSLVRCGRHQLAFTTSSGMLYVLDAPTSIVPDPPLHVVLPSSLMEGAGTVPGVGRVEILHPDTVDIPVSLSSSDETILTVPRSLTIPAGQTAVDFDIVVNDNTGLNGSRTVTVTPATTAAYTPKSTQVIVHDDESATLSLALPASVTEATGSLTGQGQVTLSSAATAAITVTLASSDTTELQVPTSVVIPAGATSAAFDLTIPDDALLDGTQTATITASVTGYASGTATVTVLDNEARTLSFGASTYTTNESSSYYSCVIMLTGTAVVPITITVTSSDSTELAATTTTTISAGSSTAYVSIPVVDDTLQDGAQIVAISATAENFTSASATVTVRDNEPASASWSTIGSTQTAGTSFYPTLTLKTIDGLTAEGFYGYATITATNANGSVTLKNAPLSVYCPNGVGNPTIAVLTAGNSTKLKAQVNSTSVSAESNTFTVQANTQTSFSFDTLASTQPLDSPVSLTIRALDAYGNTVTSFAGTAALSLVGPTATIGTGTDTNLLPLSGYYPDSRAQVLYLASEIGGAQRMTGVALQVNTAPAIQLNNWTIRIKPTTRTTLSGATWESSGWTTVHQSSPTISSTGWVEFTFDTPYDYNGTDNLLVDFSYNNTSYGSAWGYTYCTYDYTAGVRSLYYQTANSYGDPLTWGSDTSPTPYSGYFRHNLRWRQPPTGGALTPATTGAFTSGVWNGSVTFTAEGSNLVLRATSGSYTGESNVFAIVTGFPVIDTPPASQTVTLGQPVSLSVVAHSDTPLSYQWYLDGDALTGATASTYTLSAATLAQAGSYTVTVTNSIGSITSTAATLTVEKLAQSITFAALADRTYSPDALSLTATASSGLPVAFTVKSGPATITGSALTLTGIGTVVIEATQAGDATYAAATAVPRNFTVSQATATVTLSGLTTTYDGTPKTVTATTAPAGLSVNLTYAGDTTAPTHAGSYAVVATVAEANYEGSASGTLVIGQAAQAITFAALADHAFTTSPIALSASASSGLTVAFSILAGPAALDGNNLTLQGAGSITVRAAQTGNDDYLAADSVDHSFNVPTSFAAWRYTKFGAIDYADASVSGATADPDGDGYTNLLEYALGLEPKTITLSNVPVIATASTAWTYTFTRPADRPDLTYAVEVSTDLSTWTTNSVTLARTASADANGDETWQATYPLAGATNVFFRLKVMLNE